MRRAQKNLTIIIVLLAAMLVIFVCWFYAVRITEIERKTKPVSTSLPLRKTDDINTLPQYIVNPDTASLIQSFKNETSFIFLFWLTSLSAIAGNITVQNGNDDGPGSLRQAIANAKNGDVISFSNQTTVLLTSSQLVMDKNITIDGMGSTIKGS